jgi:hypothetical protein
MSKEGDPTWHATLRFAAGVTLAFVVSEAMRWSPSFLAPVLTAVLLTNLPIRPTLKMGLGLMIVITAAALFAFAVASLLRGTPTVMFGVIALCVFAAFHAILSGRPPLPAMLLLICLATIPVVVMIAPAQAGVLPSALIRSMSIALLTIWIVYVPWPLAPAPRPPTPPAARTGAPGAMALAGVAIVMPLMLVYLLFGLADVLPVMIATVMLVANFDLQRGRMHALGMIVGNSVGGLLGLLLHAVLVTTPTLPFLGVLLFVVSLGIAQRVSAGGPSAGLALLTCNAMLIILSTAISSDAGTLSLLLIRVFQFTLAGAFAVGTMSLVWASNHVSGRKRSPGSYGRKRRHTPGSAPPAEPRSNGTA